jgi:hypothetical protein
MSTLVVYSDTTDGTLVSISGTDDSEGGGTPGTYAAARAGTGDGGLSAPTAMATLTIGQYRQSNPAGFTFEVDEAFLAFNTSSIPDGDTVSAAVLNLTSQNDSSNTDFTIEARLYDWGTGLTAADWQSAPSGTLLAHRDTASGWTATTAYDLTDDAFAANVNKTGSTRLLLCSDHTTGNTAPTGPEAVGAYSADTAGTTSDPKLTVTYATASVWDGPGPTLDAVISKTASASFTANAVLRVARAGSFTADAAIKRNQTGSFTANAVIKRTQSSSFTANAAFRVGRTGSLTADAIVKRTQASAFTANAAIFRTITGSFTANATIMPTFRADAVVRRTQTGSATADAVIMPVFRADAIIRVTQSGTFTANAWLFGTTVFGFAADAVLFKTITSTLTADAVLRVARAGSLTADAAIKKTASGTFTANAVIKAAIPGSALADAIRLRTFWFGSVEAGF